MNMSKLQFDPRLWVAVNHISLLIIGILFFNFQRIFLQIFITTGTTLLVDVCLRYFFRKKSLCLKNLLSPTVTGLSLVLLLNSHSISVYIFSAIASIVSKYTLCINKKHFFNPSLFGVVATYCYFDFDMFDIQYFQFMGMGYSAIQLCVLGFFTLYFAKRILMPVFYYTTLIIGVYVINLFWNEMNLIELIGPELSASGILFTFFMMTDPVTSPSVQREQILFSVLCALISLAITTNQILHGNFLSLFILNSINMFFVWKKYVVFNLHFPTSPQGKRMNR